MEASRSGKIRLSWSVLNRKIHRWSENPSALEISAFYGQRDDLNSALSEEGVHDLGTPLMLACLNGQLEAVKILVEAGANVNHADQFGRTPIHAACWRGHIKVLRFLVQRGASLDAVVHVSNVDHNIVSGDTPLHCACKGLASADNVVRELLAWGADPNAKNELGQTPLHLAVGQNVRPRKVELLLKGGALVSAADGRGWHPIYYAVATSLIKLVEFSADINELDPTGANRLQCFEGRCRMYHGLQAALALGGGLVKCLADKCGCGTTILMCEYRACCRTVEELKESDQRNSTPLQKNRYYRAFWSRLYFEKYFILTAVAGISLGEENRPPDRLLHVDNYWTIKRWANFKNACSAEFAKMDATIPGTRATYKGVLLQQPSALRDPKLKKILTLNHCKSQYHCYGELIHCRFIVGQRKLQLIQQCSTFFTSKLGFSRFPEICKENILIHLHEGDLRNLMAV